MLKVFFFTLMTLLLPNFLWAQSQTDTSVSKPAYYYYTKVPPFEMALVNGKTFSDKNIKQGRSVLIFLFLPDCKYCHKELNLILAQMQQFEKTQIIMVTYQSPDEMRAYYQAAGLKKYANIKMGYQPNRALIGFYGLKAFPGLYLYNKDDKLVYHHEGTIPVDTLLSSLK